MLVIQRIFLLILWLAFISCTPRGIGNITEDQSCAEKSDHWNDTTHNAFKSDCDPLYYDKQYCLVENKTEWDCLRHRAVMHNHDSCQCIKKSDVLMQECFYVEICAFVDPEFKCDKNYTCTVSEDDVINCTGHGLPKYVAPTKCHRSLIHHPTGMPFDPLPKYLPAQYQRTLNASCRASYIEIFGNDSTVYYIDQVHIEGESNGFYTIRVLIAAPGDENNTCNRLLPDHPIIVDEPSTSREWKIIVPVLIGFILLVLIVFGSLKLRRYLKKDDKKWDKVIGNTTKYMGKLYDSGTAISDETEYTREEFDQIPPEGLQLPTPSDTTVTDPQDDKVEICPDAELLVAEEIVSSDPNRARLNSYENSSYERLARPGIYDVNSAMPHFSTNRFTSECDSGYSPKPLPICEDIHLSTSTGFQTSSSNVQPLLETHVLQPISEDSQQEGSNENLVEEPNNTNSCNQEEPDVMLCLPDSKSIINPTYRQ